jgi:hypothetical protein
VITTITVGAGTVENSAGSSFPSVNLGSNACDGSTVCP